MAASTGNWQLRDSEEIVTGNEALLGREHLLVAMTRMRNEALILPDTLDHLADQVDAIVAYDDASTDDTVDILRRHPKVALIVANRSWEADVDARKRAEGRHRGLLLDMARADLPHRWMFCFDPDERVTGHVRSFVEGLDADACDAVRVKLFDAYITPEDCEPYRPDRPLLHFRRFYGPEQRDILMLWRNHAGIGFAEGDGRTPRGMNERQDRSPLPALRQVALGRALGRDLRLLHPPLPLRDLRQEMERPQRSGRSYQVGFRAAAL